jgi:hypothetical protein
VAALLAGALGAPITRAQPAPDLTSAKDLYQSAEAAMKDGRFDDAVRDYGAAYELSKDPALFFKIGRANERAGRCDIAVAYYARYLREGKPTEQFTVATQERIAACGGDARNLEGSAAPVAPQPSGDARRSAGSAEPASAGGAEPVSAGSAGPAGPGSGTTAGAGAAVAPGATDVPASVTPSHGHKVAWIMTGGAIALVTLGGVLAYAAGSSENDVRDLYVGFAGQPPTFDAATRKRYDELIDEGRRYEHLSWVSFGLAGATAVGAAVLFVLGNRDEAPPPRVTPIVTTTGAGVAVSF